MILKIIKTAAFILLITNQINAFSQQADSLYKVNIKIRYASFDYPYVTPGRPIENAMKSGNYQIEASYRIYKFVDLGLYFAFSNFDCFQKRPANIVDSIPFRADIKRTFTPFFGLNTNIHLIPAFYQRNARFDLYISGKLGGCFIPSPDNYVPHGFYSDYSIFGGLTFNLTKRIGLFAEIGLRKKVLYTANKFNGGLSIRF